MPADDLPELPELPELRTYLAGLDRAADAAGLDPDRAARLRAEVTEHVQESLMDAPDAGIAAVLRTLGSPEQVLAEALGRAAPDESGHAGHGFTHPLALGTPRSGSSPRLEEAALACVAGSLLLFGLGVLALPGVILWVAGLVLVAISARWNGGDKALAALAFGVLGVPLLAAASPLRSGAASGAAGVFSWAAALLLVALWVWMGVRLWRRAHAGVRSETLGLRMGRG